MNRSSMTLIGAVVALGALTGVAAVAAPDPGAAAAPSSAARQPVERTTLVCPQPTMSDVASTDYTAFTPKGAGTAGRSAAELYPAPAANAAGDPANTAKKGKDGTAPSDSSPELALKSPGAPIQMNTTKSTAPALTGSATGALAPGWTVQQTTEVAAGAGRGLQGTACGPPDTDFWFPGASTAASRQDYVHLTNPDDTAAVVDVDLYGKQGRESTSQAEGVDIPPHSSVPLLLSTLDSKQSQDVTVHVVSRTGRVGAQVQGVDKKSGGDWLPPTADAAPSAVIPGIPGDAAGVRLVVFAPGGQDADLKVRLAGPHGQITPAGYDTLHVPAGRTTGVDLKDLTKGDPGSLVLTPADKGQATPVVAAAEITRGKGEDQELGFIPSTAPIDKRATAADNTSGNPTLAFTATDSPATVRITSTADGGSPATKTVTVKPGTTQQLAPPKPQGSDGGYAVTVEKLSGGPVYASRMLAKKDTGVPEFTIQPLPDDRGWVSVPRSGQDLSVLTQR